MSCSYTDGDNYYDDLTGLPCNPSGGLGLGGGIGPGNVIGPTVYGGGNNPQGTQTVNPTLNTILQSILSGVALFKRAPYVPTSNNPYNQAPPTIITGGGGGIGGGGIGSGSNNNNSSITAGTVGKVEAWIKKNPGVSGMLAIGVLLYFAKPPQRGK